MESPDKINNIVKLNTPAVRARAHIENVFRETPTLQQIILGDFDKLLRGESTPYLAAHPEMMGQVLRILNHYKTPLQKRGET